MNNAKFSLAARILSMGMVVALVLIGTAMGEVSRDGLVAEYHFDSDAKDSSGNGHDMEIYGATFVDGKVGKALSFNGVDDYLYRADDDNLDITGDMSVIAWINHAETSSGDEGIISKESRPKYAYQFVIRSSNKIHFFHRNSGSQSEGHDSLGTVSPSSWHQVAYTISGTTLTFYIDGSSSGSSTLLYSRSGTNGNLYIGVENPAPKNYFNGLIDEVRIYNRALSAEEIKAEYDSYTTPSSSQLTSASTTLSSTITSNASPVSTSLILENANNYKVLLDSEISLQDSASLSHGAYYVVSYSNLLPYASGIEIFSSEGKKITSESEAEPVFTSIAWKEASGQVKPSDIQTMKDILQTSKDIDSAVSPVISVTGTTISSINSLKNACISVPFVGKKCAWDAVSSAFPGISTLASQLESLNSELDQWKSAAASAQQHLPNAISGIEQAKSGGDINPQLQSEISQSLSAFGTLQSKTNQMSEKLASVSSTLSDAESGVRNAAETPVVGSLISPVANAIGSMHSQVDSLKGKADSFSSNMGEQRAKLSAVTDTANKRDSELKSQWNARQSASTMVYGTIGGVVAVLIIVILLIRKKRSAERSSQEDKPKE
ncbi:Concanavalin A-like lectin/glucanases superfamily protein [uncultured archaeon]|nr:Concanavalin A-like lectin/glucanases superfamily protein [uncultured archaeon]